MVDQGTVFELRVHQGYASTLLKEAKGLSASAVPNKDQQLAALRRLVIGFAEIVESSWRNLSAGFEKQGMSLIFAQACVHGVRFMVDSTRELHRILEEQGGSATDLAHTIEAIDRVEGELKAVEFAVSRRPRLDPEKTRRGIEAAERGEGEDLGALVAALQSGEEA